MMKNKIPYLRVSNRNACNHHHHHSVDVMIKATFISTAFISTESEKLERKKQRKHKRNEEQIQKKGSKTCKHEKEKGIRLIVIRF